MVISSSNHRYIGYSRMKKIREEIIEYYYDEETGRVIKKIQENRLISEENGEEQWQKTSRSIPIA